MQIFTKLYIVMSPTIMKTKKTTAFNTGELYFSNN
jgi:hypothetical protein